MKMDKKKWLYIGIGAATVVVILAIVLLVVLLPKNGETKEPEMYKITVESVQNGQIITDKQQATEGETVTVTATPESRYELESLYYSVSGENKTTIENNAFIMPASNVTVGGTFVLIKTEITATSNIGQFSALGGGLYYTGDEVTLSVSLNDDESAYETGFVGWYAGDEIVSDQIEYAFTLTEDSPQEYTAKFITNLDSWEIHKNDTDFTCSLSGDSFERITDDLVIPSYIWLSKNQRYTVTAIEDQAFYNNRDCDSIFIPSTVRTIGKSAFQDSWLNYITFGRNSVLESIGANAFDGSRLKNIVIPASVTSIGSYAFSDSNLANITFEESSRLETIPEYAFSGCTYLETLTLPANIKEIGQCAFYDSGLESIILNEGLLSIGDNAFDNCSIEEIVIPSTVTTLGSNLFHWVNSLRTITIEGADVYQLLNTEDVLKDKTGLSISTMAEIKVRKSVVEDSTNNYLNNSEFFDKSEEGDYYIFQTI